MKNVLVIIFFFIFAIASATDYYVSNAGNDSNTGTSSSTPWKTVTKVNSSFSILKPGDRILLKRGDTFYGSITITKSGSSTNPITIGAYGSGDNPVITGFTTITGWINEGNGIYSKVLTSEAQTNMVTIDGVHTGMARYPKSTYQTYESVSTNTSITDNGLGDATNWTGAEVVIRKNDWTLDRCIITKHTGDVLTYTSLGTNQNSTSNYGYFIQNDLRCVTKYGDWYQNKSTGKFYMYFGTVDPSTKTVNVATLNNLVTNQSGGDYIILDNISLSGSIENAVNYTWQNDYCTIQNCGITFAGLDGIRLFGDFGIINNNQITNCNGYGIYSYGLSALITNNTLKNISIITGQSKGWLEFVGIFIEKNNCIVKNNRIENVGYNGIAIGAAANNINIENNFISNSCLILNDGGGIYLSGTHSSIRINGNIILNAVGSYTGTPKTTLMAEGIYLDESANHITVSNNTIANCSNSGIKLHKAHDNIIINNVSFNNYTGIDFENWTGNSTIYNNIINGNIFFAKIATQFTLKFSSVTNDIPGFGTADNNYYARPLDDNLVIYTNQSSVGTKYRTLADWQTFTRQDFNSHKSPITITNSNYIRFEYNETNANKIITLNNPMIDVKGAKYVNSITLIPYTSLVLMIDPNPSQPVIPLYTGSVINNSTPSILEITYNVSLANIIPAVSTFIVQVNSVVRPISSVAISGPKVMLTLSSQVVNGDVVTVSYTKPSSNALRATSGGQSASFVTQAVTNNVNPQNLPIYIASVIENNSPNQLEMTFNINMANIIPPSTAFVVQVNGITRNVISVTISGSKIFLTLNSPVVYGDKLTISYNKPLNNWLQTTSGVQAAGISSQLVTNNCLEPSKRNDPPKAIIQNDISNYSGFVGEIDASGSSDINNDILTFEWQAPSGIALSSTNSSKIQFLAPIVNSEHIYKFSLKVNDGTNSVTSIIPISILPYKPELNVANILDVEASSYNSTDYPTNVIDGEIETKWSANVDNQWILLKLEKPFAISHLEISFLPEQNYESYFDILVSKDNLVWQSVYDKISSCDFSGGMQVFDFPPTYTDTSYTYIKLIGHGNSLNELISFSELRIFGTPEEKLQAKNAEIKIKIYPNPANDFLNIAFNEPTHTKQIMHIIDLSGKIVFTRTIERGNQFLRIPINLKTGNFIITLLSGSLMLFSQRIVISH